MRFDRISLFRMYINDIVYHMYNIVEFPLLTDDESVDEINSMRELLLEVQETANTPYYCLYDEDPSKKLESLRDNYWAKYAGFDVETSLELLKEAIEQAEEELEP